MNTQTINKICEKDFFISKYYIGCFACDQLPNTYPENALAVVNLDRMKDFGSHWVVVSSLDKNRTLYLDSFGRPLKNSYIVKCTPLLSFGMKETSWVARLEFIMS